MLEFHANVKAGSLTHRIDLCWNHIRCDNWEWYVAETIDDIASARYVVDLVHGCSTTQYHSSILTVGSDQPLCVNRATHLVRQMNLILYDYTPPATHPHLIHNLVHTILANKNAPVSVCAHQVYAFIHRVIHPDSLFPDTKYRCS